VIGFLPGPWPTVFWSTGPRARATPVRFLREVRFIRC
jgi:hypothetical protein